MSSSPARSFVAGRCCQGVGGGLERGAGAGGGGDGAAGEAAAAGAGRWVLAECGAVQRRFRVLPARLGVYFVLGLACSRAGVLGGAGELTAGLEGRLAAAGWVCPSTTALSRLRRRLGEAPFAALLGRWPRRWPGRAARVAGLRAAGGGLGRDGAGGPGQRGERRGAGPAARDALPAGAAGGAGGVRDAGRAGRGARGAAERELAAGCRRAGQGDAAAGRPRVLQLDLWARPPGPALTCCGGCRATCTCPRCGCCPTGAACRCAARPRRGGPRTAATTAASARPRRRPRRRPAPDTGPGHRVPLAVTGSDGSARAESYRLSPPCSARRPRLPRRWPPPTPAGGPSRPRSRAQDLPARRPGSSCAGDPDGVRQELWASWSSTRPSAS